MRWNKRLGIYSTRVEEEELFVKRSKWPTVLCSINSEVNTNSTFLCMSTHTAHTHTHTHTHTPHTKNTHTHTQHPRPTNTHTHNLSLPHIHTHIHTHKQNVRRELSVR